MATDANLVLQASVTKTGSFNGAWLNLLGLTGAGGRALWAHVLYSAATNASGSNAFTFSLDVSPDGGTTAYTGAFSASDQVVTLSTTAQAGEIAIPFSLLDPKLIAGATPAIRLVVTQNGAGSTPTITYSGSIQLAFN